MRIGEMNNAVETINAWSQTWTDSIVAILWQSTALVVFVAVVALALRRASPALRFWLWQIVAIKLLLMPFWTMAIPLPFFPRQESMGAVADGPAIESSVLESGEREPPVAASPSAPLNITPGTSPAWYERLRNFTWRGWLFVMWATVVTLQVLRLFWQRIRLT